MRLLLRLILLLLLWVNRLLIVENWLRLRIIGIGIPIWRRLHVLLLLITILVEETMERFRLLDVHFFFIVAIEMFRNTVHLGKVFIEFIEFDSIGFIGVD